MKYVLAFGVVAIAILGSLQPAQAYDERRIKLFCAQLFRTRESRNFCLRIERESGRIIDQKRRNASTPTEKRVAEQCHRAYATSYTRELACFNRYLKQAAQ